MKRVMPITVQQPEPLFTGSILTLNSAMTCKYTGEGCSGHRKHAHLVKL
jgi:hypothetical protein